MMTMRPISRRDVGRLGGLVLAAASTGAMAQSGLPAKPLRIIVPWPPGGAADIVSRHLQQPLSELLGQPVVVENKAGGGGVIGAEVLARAPADGSAIGVLISAHAASPALYASLPFDAMADFIPITIVTRSPNIIVVHPSSPHKSLADIVNAAKANPGKVLVATSGNGTAQHFGLEQIKISTNTNMVQVPFKGAGPALNDLVAGQVEIGLLNIAGALPHIRANRLRPIAVTGLKRSSSLPELPTVAETIPGFDFAEWFSMAAPKGVPAHLIEALYQAIVKVARTPAFEAKIKDSGMELDLNTPAEFRAFMTAQNQKLVELAKQANIKLD